VPSKLELVLRRRERTNPWIRHTVALLDAQDLRARNRIVRRQAGGNCSALVPSLRTRDRRVARRVQPANQRLLRRVGRHDWRDVSLREMQIARTAGGLGCRAAALRHVRSVVAAARIVLRRSNESRLASNLALGDWTKAIEPRRSADHAQAAHAAHQQSPQKETMKHRPLFYGAIRSPANTRRPRTPIANVRCGVTAHPPARAECPATS
jgi:hypothetical protein